jgi:hypothetical protein
MTVPPWFLSACLEAALVAKGGGLGERHRLQLATLALQVGVDGPLREALARLLNCAPGSVAEQFAGVELLAQVDYANRAPLPEAATGRADLDG